MLTESRPWRVLRCCDGFFLRTFAGSVVRPSPECRTSSPTTSSPPRFDGETPRSWQGREEEAATAPRHSHAWLESRLAPSCPVLVTSLGGQDLSRSLGGSPSPSVETPGITVLIDVPEQGHPGATSILVRSPCLKKMQRWSLENNARCEEAISFLLVFVRTRKLHGQMQQSWTNDCARKCQLSFEISLLSGPPLSFAGFVGIAFVFHLWHHIRRSLRS